MVPDALAGFGEQGEVLRDMVKPIVTDNAEDSIEHILILEAIDSEQGISHGALLGRDNVLLGVLDVDEADVEG